MGGLPYMREGTFAKELAATLAEKALIGSIAAADGS